MNLKVNKETSKKILDQCDCAKLILSVQDSMDALNGRWKLPILVSLRFSNKRFKEISRELNGITDKTLSKELKELEVNQLITRTVYDSFPPTVEYAITKHGLSLDTVILSLRDWGNEHRKKIIGK
jgi:DNA-binding HxlR family transcriptional regulator